MKVVSAVIKQYTFYGQDEVCIDIVTKGRDNYVYDIIQLDDEFIVRGEDGDTADFNALTNNHRGIGGATKVFKLANGQTLTHKGPWSSRCGVVNALWPHKEPLVECVDVSKYNVVTYVRKDVLERFGIKLQREVKWGNEVYYKPIV